MSTGLFALGSKWVRVTISSSLFSNLLLFLVELELVLQVHELALLLDLYRGLQAEPQPQGPEDLEQLSAAYLLVLLVLLDVLGQVVHHDGRLLRVVRVRCLENLPSPVVEVLYDHLPVGLLLYLRSAGYLDPLLHLGHLPGVDHPELSVFFQGTGGTPKLRLNAFLAAPLRRPRATVAGERVEVVVHEGLDVDLVAALDALEVLVPVLSIPDRVPCPPVAPDAVAIDRIVALGIVRHRAGRRVRSDKTIAPDRCPNRQGDVWMGERGSEHPAHGHTGKGRWILISAR